MDYTIAQERALLAMIAFRKAEREICRDEGRVCRAYGLTPIQFGVMETLYSRGDLRVGELMDALLSTPGNMTVVVRNMERDGYITRKQDPQDKRSFLLSLTEKGDALIREMLPQHAAVVEEIFSVLTPKEQTALARLLRKFYDKEQDDNG